jgi:ribosomal protein L33
MAKKGKGAEPIILKSTESGHCYHYKRNSKNKEPLELTKYDPYLQRRVVYKQKKK